MLKKISMVVFVLAFGTFIYASSAEAGYVEDGLLSYWNFDEAEEDNVEDVVSGYNGFFDGEIAVVDGKFNKGLEFDGTDAMVVMEDSDDFNCLEAFTWTAWIKTDAANGCIVNFTDAILDSDVQGAKTFRVLGGILDINVGWVGGVSGTTTVNDGEWHYVAMVVEDDVVAYYVDGEEDGGGGLAVSSKPEEGFVITVGWDPRCGMVEFPPFIGIIDEVSHYSRALSSDEMEQNFEAGALDLAVEPADKLTSTWGGMKASR